MEYVSQRNGEVSPGVNINKMRKEFRGMILKQLPDKWNRQLTSR